MVKISKDFIKKLDDNIKDKTFFDDEIPHFALRVQGKTKSYIFMYRNTAGTLKKYKIGTTKEISLYEAKERAKDLNAEVRQGKDPESDKIAIRKIFTVKELCEYYIQEGVSHKKLSTIEDDKSRIKRHILPLIGNQPITSINKQTIYKFMNDIISGNSIYMNEKSDKPRGRIKVTGGKSAAVRTLQLLKAIFNFAIDCRIIQENPMKGLKYPSLRKKEEFLEDSEIQLLGNALIKAENELKNINFINAIRILLLTGCRKEEIIGLKWKNVDFSNSCFRFEDTKTGPQTRPFGLAVLNLLKNIQYKQNKNNIKTEYVFPSRNSNRHIVDIRKFFCSILKSINNDVLNSKTITIHTLRHTFASFAAQQGYSELTIAGLLGHRVRGVTNRYSHLPDKSIKNAADDISCKIYKLINNETEECKIIEMRI